MLKLSCSLEASERLKGREMQKKSGSCNVVGGQEVVGGQRSKLEAER